MRNTISKVLTSSMVAGAALLVAACGGTESASTDNAASADMNAMDPAMTGTTNDVTAIDAATGAGGNMAGDMNMSMNATGDMGGNMMGGNMSGGNMMGGNMSGGNMSGNTM